MGAKEMESVRQRLKQLFKGAAEGKPPAAVPAENPRAASTESKGRKPVLRLKKVSTPKDKPELPKDTELVRKAIIQVGQEAGHLLSPGEKMNVLVSDDFRATIGIGSKSLLGGISRLGPTK